MVTVRPSVPGDVPAQRARWVLAFGDSPAYIDNFYRTYYRPERVVVLEEDGVVRSMTAWFATELVLPGEGRYRAAYLYAVATHPESRGRGLAGKLLSGTDDYFRTLSIPAVTTVPAEESLHNFFGRNGFRECFTQTEEVISPENLGEGNLPLRPVTAAEYGALREELLADIPHIFLPEDALAYQAGCCAVSGGGLYAGETPFGPVALCAEGMENGTLLGKELLGGPKALAYAKETLSAALPQFGGQWRTPGTDSKFGMLKWLDLTKKTGWDWKRTAYLGLAFD
jgi:GNAT superfamily N-acetyltransferase